MIARLRTILDPFILALLGTVLLASLLPARGQAAVAAGWIADAGIVLLFFLHGAKLSREAIVGGARNWRLHLTVFAVTFGLFPLIGVGASSLPFLSPTIATGLLFVTLLPSTVQSSIAFTAVARGNVAAAVCSASFSNLAGIFVTPLLVALTIHSVQGGAGLSFDAARTIALQLLLPFVLGHLCRPLIGGFVARHKAMTMLVDRGSILIVVYTAFGAAVVEGLWHRLSPQQIGLIAILCLVILAMVLFATWALGRVLGFPREDAIVLLFCGSKKSLASGVPMAGVLFPAAQVGPIILPLMLFHQFQLIACAVIARHYAAQADAAPVPQAA
ncbi:bile acid:sodium symporter family protein [Sphingomonas profundi]|uniref:bile acid:sodium symporter family protein n=1 Tax=Alterirhizorhabdus profundi TaxID=2681549 RepID=UPI0012E9257B|nr:bile acid:sodium symporter family protein [Sphingomonas profundi]